MKSPLFRATAIALLAIGAAVPARPARADGLEVTQTSVLKFIMEMSREHDFSPTDLAILLHDAQVQPRILEIMERPAERAMTWGEYRQRFLTDERIDGGVRVWQDNRDALAAVERDTGVPAQYLVAITGVETFYGRITGNYRVLDSLATLAFGYPRRAGFFKGELEQFLLMTREEGIDPRVPKGSYAGAMGIPQFMPSSFRRYAVDASGNGKPDLWNYGPDVFASIAHYFKEHGWRPGEPVLSDAANDAAPDDPARPAIVLKDTVDSLHARGYRFDTALPGAAPTLLIPAMLDTGTTWRVGYQNFYVITRYNSSLLYGMAVNDLADAIAARYKASQMVAQEK